ncbi:MAG: hypothetical protein Q7S00_06505, partial [bacterium]|nr:hypothetical protein [bacterium]
RGKGIIQEAPFFETVAEMVDWVIGNKERIDRTLGLMGYSYYEIATALAALEKLGGNQGDYLLTASALEFGYVEREGLPYTLTVDHGFRVFVDRYQGRLPEEDWHLSYEQMLRLTSKGHGSPAPPASTVPLPFVLGEGVTEILSMEEPFNPGLESVPAGVLVSQQMGGFGEIVPLETFKPVLTSAPLEMTPPRLGLRLK